MTHHNDSFPTSPDDVTPLASLPCRDRLAALAEGAGPPRAPANSLIGAFELMQLGGLGGAATAPVTHGKCVLLYTRILPRCPIALCVVWRWVIQESYVLRRVAAWLPTLLVGQHWT